MDLRRSTTAIDLNGAWNFAWSMEEITDSYTSSEDLIQSGLAIHTGQVPGNFELDLQRNGLIDEPFFGMNIASLFDYERANVWYYRRFTKPDNTLQDAWLVLEGVDCCADIYLNGVLLMQADNMLIPFETCIEPWIEEENEIFIHLFPPSQLPFSDIFNNQPANLHAHPAGYDSLYVRKAPHQYGWDIMPRALSRGLWRPVRVDLRPRIHLLDVMLETLSLSAKQTSAEMRLKVLTNNYLHLTDGYELEIEGICGESHFHATAPLLNRMGHIRFTITNPALWWVRGRGEQNLYEVTVRLWQKGILQDSVAFTFGVRTVELERTSVTDSQGNGKFCFKVNGEPIFVMGTNWVPVDAYHSRDRERIPAILDMVEEIGCNMIRCWGGNVYEDDLFYEICDHKGILIWQDFAMACATYPQDMYMQNQITTEARAIVRRLRMHPCIALWAGDNECDQAWSWGGRKQDPNQNLLTRQVIPQVLRDEDATRPYLPSSPFIDPVAFQAGEAFLPENHLWGPRDYYKSPYYTGSLCHFASEIGYHGCPDPESLREFLSADKVWHYADNEEWLLHSTSPIPGAGLYDYRVELMAKQIRELFGTIPENLEDFAFASQISQAEAKKFFIEMFRTAKWRRTGIIWWNLMDGWPQFSDAVVDYYFRKKQAYHFIRRAQQPLSITLREPANWSQEIVVCNDTREDIPITYRIIDVATDEIVAEGTGTTYRDSVTVLANIPYSTSYKRLYKITWQTALGDGKNHYLAGNPPFSLEEYRLLLAKANLNP